MGRSRTGLGGRAALAVLAVSTALVGAGSAHAQVARAGRAFAPPQNARVPGSPRAVWFQTGVFPQVSVAEAAFTQAADGEGYRTATIVDPNFSDNNPGKATLANFVKNAPGAGLLVYVGHGAGPPQDSEQLLGPVEVHGTNPTNTTIAMNTRYGGLLRQGLIIDCMAQQGFVRFYGICLTPAGVMRFFKGRESDSIVQLNACSSFSWQDVFLARAFFGYVLHACPQTVAPDTVRLWRRLAGRQNRDLRSTSNAWQAAGFTSIFRYSGIGLDATLSPSVNEAAPDAVTVGQVADGRIEFDTHMNARPPSQVLEPQLSPCGGRVFNERWIQSPAGPTMLTFKVAIKRPSKRGGRIIVKAADAVAGPPGARHKLDGNGVAPNGDDYVLDVKCLGKPRSGSVPRCPIGHVPAHEVCVIFDGSGSGTDDTGAFGWTASASVTWRQVWFYHYPDGIENALEDTRYTTASGRGQIHYNPPPLNPDCAGPLRYDPSSRTTYARAIHLHGPDPRGDGVQLQIGVPMFWSVATDRACPGQSPLDPGNAAFPEARSPYPLRAGIAQVIFHQGFKPRGVYETKYPSRTQSGSNGSSRWQISWEGTIVAIVGPR